MKLIPEVTTVEELVFIATEMLLGTEGVEFSYYKNDSQWWELRLYMRRN